MGHSKTEMTEKYLEPGRGEFAQSKINKAFGNFETSLQPSVSQS